jgi:protein tyrosine phosphatase (PTP) superfamily phosphohydrolase (DUF442 family)
MRSRELAAGLALLLAAGSACAATAEATALSAPNVVAITPRLVTSGQPPAKTLAALASQGFQAVIYLAPPTVHDAVRDEAVIVGRQGLVFANIPIRFDDPTERDYEAFAAMLGGLADRKVLVHCQINMRASSLVFLYRVIALKENPDHAYEAVARIWSPDGVWKRFIVTMLRKHGVGFEPY